MSTLFHPQTDGQTERANRSIGQILQAVVNHDQRNWVDKIDMVEFAINSSISETTGYFPFELNYGYMPSMIKEIRNNEIVSQGIKAFAASALQNLADAHDAIIEARTFQTHAANKLRKEEPRISIGDLVYLSTKNLDLPKGRARKLCPKFVGPFKVAKTHPETPTICWNYPQCYKRETYSLSSMSPYYGPTTRRVTSCSLIASSPSRMTSALLKTRSGSWTILSATDGSD